MKKTYSVTLAVEIDTDKEFQPFIDDFINYKIENDKGRIKVIQVEDYFEAIP